MTDVAHYIVGFYNSTRLHCKLGYLSPNAFERKSATQHPIDVSEITRPPQNGSMRLGGPLSTGKPVDFLMGHLGSGTAVTRWKPQCMKPLTTGSADS